MTRSVAVLLAFLASGEVAPAAIAVDGSCASYEATHTLVRNDVLAKLDAAEENLSKAEAALVAAETDLLKAKAAMDALQSQRQALLDHVDALTKVVVAQSDSPMSVETAVANAWEWADAPLAFAAGAGTCVGLAWGLTQVQR